jgi:hypothetical protein
VAEALWRGPMRTVTILVLIIGFLLAPGRASALDMATGKGASGFTMAAGGLEELGILTALGSGALGNCFVGSIRWGGMETCTSSGWPRVCVRFRNNYLQNLLEASGKRHHFALQTVMSAAFLEAIADSQSAAPSAKKLGVDMGMFTSGSGRVQGRTLAPPLLYEALGTLVQGASLNSLCRPTDLRFGYIYFAEGDETGAGQTLWRSIISPYYLNRMTSGISLFAKAVETVGMCGLDVNFMLCIGGYGTKYPTSGDIAASSPALRLITGAWRAQEIHAAPAGTYGPYDTSLGPVIHSQMHLPLSMAGGVTAVLPPYSPGSYTQWLYPGMGSLPVGNPDTFCQVLGVGAGTSPQAMNQMLSEAINKTWIEEDTLAFAYWTRWTCCNWCQGADDAAVKHMIPEQGYSPVLTRKP